MYIRCAECHAAAWLETLAPGESDPSLTCKSCGRVMILLSAGELGVTSEEQQERALQFASYHQIDLPSAYSVLLGLMPLESAQAAREDRKRDSVGGPASPDRVGATGAAPADAVAAARSRGLSPGEARQLATRLARRHGLPMRLALLVAENKLSLHSAVARASGSVDDDREASRPATPAQKKMIWAFGLACALAIVIHTAGAWSRSAQQRRAAAINAERAAAEAAAAATVAQQPEPASPTELAKIERDDQGRIVAVRGPNPRLVLLAWCEAQTDTAKLAPVELTNSSPPSASRRLGIFRDHSEVDALLAVTIRRDRETGWWVIGDGVEPIEPFPAPDLPPGTKRFAVLAP